MDSEKWTETAAQAIATPPGCLKGFKVAVVDPKVEDRPSHWADFAVQCGKCGESHFQVLGFPLIAPDPSPYHGIEPGKIFFRPPHRLRCVSCGHTAELFDPRKHGYNGALNLPPDYETGDDDEQPANGQNARFLVSLTFGYSIELEELLESAEDEGVAPSDLFDFVEIRCKSVDNGSDLYLDYECA